MYGQDYEQTTRTLQRAPNRLECSTENMATTTGVEGRAAHVNCLARARARAQTRATSLPTEVEGPLKDRSHGQTEATPFTVVEERSEGIKHLGDSAEALRGPPQSLQGAKSGVSRFPSRGRPWTHG